MKKTLLFSISLLVVALAGVLFWQLFSVKASQTAQRPIKVGRHVKNKVINKSGTASKKEAASTPAASEPATEAKWIKSDTPIKFPILMYHHIADVVGGNTLFVPASEFKMEMETLKQAGYYTLSPEEAYRVLTTNEKPAEKIVWLTFDDGYKNAHDAAMPILKELGMKGSFFIISGMVGDEDKMTEASLLDMKATTGMALESHTVHHVDLGKASTADATMELTTSKQYLDQLLKQKTSVICYPSGRYNDGTGHIAEQAGYKLGLTTNPGLASSADGLFSLNRVRISYGHTASSFLSLIGDH
ncbi:MAG: polysaccharide deacetylase family protein [Streptococcaceae bacterium]|jgi:peptidoglycan/xylan/chitin deacetylase (PgdA/CDA1 family)|nr:polysaccharide deacetylase family protein [Streptococcaceae bacterium]